LATREEIVTRLEKVKAKFSEEKIQKEFANFSKTLEYVFKDKETSFCVSIQNGVPSDFQEKKAEKPDIQLIMDSQTFVEIMDGKLSGMKAYASGKVKLKGSIRDLMKLQKLM